MDPLTALGLGANILTIIDCGVQLVRITRDVIESGATNEIYHYEQISLDLENVAGNLILTPGFAGQNNTASIDKPTRALVDLAQKCKTEAEAMVTKIKSSQPRKKTNGKTSRKAAVKSAASTLWNRSDNEAMARRLDSYRGQLGLRMLEVVNARSIEQGTNIVEILSLSQSIDSSFRTVAALLKTRQGSTEALLSNERPAQADRLTNMLSVTYQDCGAAATRPDASKSSNYSAAATEVSFPRVVRKIVDSLYFDFARSREEMLSSPFEKTFDWISGEQNVDEAEWDDFPSWLRAGKGCYWIGGKAGSGKSTLMKCIANHPLLTQNLRVWAGGDDLLRISFFFWRVGMDPLQKTQEGFLRSLLLQVLTQRGDLATVCFPVLCSTLSRADRYREDLQISFDNLNAAFLRLTRYPLLKTKLFLLIDGLDEFQGDPQNLISLLQSIIKSPAMKLLVSSRPTPLLHQALNQYPGLKMHELTQNDIRHYAEEKLAHDITLTTMNRLEPNLSNQLIETIVSKASGVFLWVSIVVRDLLYGLAHSEPVETLWLNIDKLPTDLLDLFDHMFLSMTPSHRKEASRMMRLLLRSQEVQFDYPMTALQLAFAQIKEAPGLTITPWTALSKQEEDVHCDLVEGRLRSRCCGLLEVQKSCWGLQDPRKYIGFLHKTVLDYLEQEEIQSKLLAWDTISIDLDDNLLSSCVMEVRQFSQAAHSTSSAVTATGSRPTARRSQNRQRPPSTATRILHAIALCPVSESGSQNRYDAIVNEMAQIFWSLPEAARDDVSRRASLKGLHPFLSEMNITMHDRSQNFWMYAAFHGIVIGSRTASGIDSHDTQCGELALFNNLLHLSNPTPKGIQSRLASGVFQLLHSGTDPNQPCLYFGPPGSSNEPPEIEAALRLAPNQARALIPWIFWLSCRRKDNPIISQDYLLYMELLARMIIAGAKVREMLGSNDPKIKQYVYEDIEKCIQAMPDTTKEAIDLRSHVRSVFRSAMANSRNEKSPSFSTKISKPFRLLKLNLKSR